MESSLTHIPLHASALPGSEGTLYVVATPIGNLGDLTLRAIEVLRKVDLIAAEDTRTSRPLLDHFGIMAPLISLHQHNEREKAQLLIRKLQEGHSVALISDAGTPAISDPGARVVDEVLNAGGKVVPIPGVSAVTTLLSVAGMTCPQFYFHGFLPAKKGERQRQIQSLGNLDAVVVFYEAPHRILATLTVLAQEWGGARRVTLGRELTKRFETLHRSTLEEAVLWVQADPNQQRGEFVLAIEPAPVVVQAATALEPSQERWLAVLLTRLPVKEAVQLMGEATGLPRNQLYAEALRLKGP
ncbi:16S rRNA (cytidine(1402)-2'-O)-methyltransferase [Ferrovum myxofaciens]|jgi:16S rRNA (cytidine1402-2'-O)-methyltransferase|uniref:16S rRNA (cytidine(1402)-2'-O)-methyltransferase n=1 Tax=Ferrovum myxofaciens TaxID=416213 RepID=UPI00068AC53F|nr:16S rRNA (cytidine(1402)-2'-O)-methyltransferase [Ferrovum myxofaciens]MBU6995279.1 16S rRNA (cytidine(1402)-2'-O)-methyltransferase [Ferrovum myxofaciens]MBW8028409.1 16S rRNA (cytidine(1402)-2'-O)-methyltransferase [Ferrovum sp.]NDU88659.1 16S rRNA (cytidine(1402)-2'-O)-methyltransferase [Ferrovum sp.]QKE41651.1 MAG: 16S rRNA (cytidine(1402)-2'-O)-methyltransferase [Ferrovum myxofaciens]